MRSVEEAIVALRFDDHMRFVDDWLDHSDTAAGRVAFMANMERLFAAVPTTDGQRRRFRRRMYRRLRQYADQYTDLRWLSEFGRRKTWQREGMGRGGAS